VERLVAGRERILLDRFYNELSANPARIDEQTRDHYAALYARPGAIHNAFSGQFAAFAQDAIDNQELLAKGKLPMPVLAIGGAHSHGARLATEIAFAALFVARINSRAQSAPRHGRRTYSGRPSSSMRFSVAMAMATSVICRPRRARRHSA
jgi:hypothetical protein